MSRNLEAALEAEVVAQDLERLAHRLRQSSRSDLFPFISPLHDDRSRRSADNHAELARRIYDMRRNRAEYFPAELFGEAAWDLLLDLYIRQVECQNINVTSACLASGVPNTTALRWICALEEAGLAERCTADHDRRVTHIRLTERGRVAMLRFLESVEDAEPSERAPFLRRMK